MRNRGRVGARRAERAVVEELQRPDIDVSPSWRRIALAGALVVFAYLALRVGANQPWGYDDYYHLGIARESSGEFPLQSLPWTPLSQQASGYADKEFLFHLLLMPIAKLPVAWAAFVGVGLGLGVLVASLVSYLVAVRVARPDLWLLGLAGLGPLFCLRVEQLRPHVWMLGGCVLVLALLRRRTAVWILAVVSAVFGHLHTAGWLGILIAAIWVAAERWKRRPRPTWRETLLPVAAIALGWLVGQLLHPNLPRNFELLWLANVVVPSGAAGAIDESLRQALGIELSRPRFGELLEQWPIFVIASAAVATFVRRRSARTGPAWALGCLAVFFLLVGSLWMRRFLEMGGLFGLLWLALLVAEAEARHEPAPWPTSRPRVALVVLGLSMVWSVVQVRDLGRGDQRPHGRGQPQGMSGFLAARGGEGDLVFTAQWADSAPLLYAAPQLRSLVALDPTFLWRKDRHRFERYWAIAHGRSGDPLGEIERLFAARWITVWKAPGFEAFARQLRAAPRGRVALVYEDPYYEVWAVRR